MAEEIRKYKDTVEKMREERSSKLKNINSHLQKEIQECKQAIETLKESEKKYRDLVETSQNLIWKCDEEGYFTFLNTAWEKTLGYKLKDMLGQKCAKFKVPELVKRDTKTFHDILKGGSVVKYETIYVSKSGEKVYLLFTAIPLLDENNKIIGTQGTAYDITEGKKAEIALQENERRYRELADSITDVFFAMDNNLRYTYWNKASEELTGITAEEAIGKYLYELFPDAKGTKAERAYLDVLKFRKARFFENEYRVGDRYSSFEISAYPTTDGCSVFVKNIAVRKNAEKELYRLNQFQENIIENANVWINVVDNEKNILIWNKAAEKISGYSAKEVIGHDRIWEWLYPDEEYRKEVTKIADTIIRAHEGEEDGETTITCKDGRVRIISWNSRGLLGKSGNPVGSISLGRDVTGHKQTVQALQESEEHLRNLFETMTEGVVLIDPDGQIIQANTAAEHILGLKRSEIEKRNYVAPEWEIIRPDGTIMPPEEMAGPRAMKELRPIKNVIMGVRRPDGYTSWVDVSATPMQNKSGTIESIVGTFSDITERMRLEEQLQIRQRMDSLGTLASGIAHDFNNLLTGIIGYIDMLNLTSDNLTRVQKDYIENALHSSHRAADLIRQLQTLSGDVVTEKIAMDIYEIVKEVFNMIEKTTDRLIEKEVRLKAGKFYVKANTSELNQVFLNLATNAVQAIEERGTRPGDYIKVSAEDYIVNGIDTTGLPAGDYIHIVFEDNGCGMSDRVRRRAFDPLFTTRGKGSSRGQGLGLAMVFNIITRRHGGLINIQSEEGKGTSFHIYLPKSRPEQEVKESDRIKGGNETVMIIEDEDQVKNLAESLLKSYGYRVLTSVDGEQGLDTYAKNNDSVDLVLLDLTMPGMSGQMVFERMLNINPDVKVIICSGQGDDEIRKGMLSNAHGFLKKPYRVNDLAKVVRSVLDS